MFAKEPVPGEVKTRLSGALSEDEAASLYRAFLDDTVATVRACRAASTELWVSPPRSVPWFENRYPGLRVRPQEGEGLGARLRRGFSRVFLEGAAVAVAVGSDHPTLPRELVERGLDALAGTDVVLGPSDDGGYYLVGVRAPSWPVAGKIFSEIPWSTDGVLRATLARADEVGLSSRLLPGWYDVDAPSDLARLHADVDDSSETARALSVLTRATAPGE